MLQNPQILKIISSPAPARRGYPQIWKPLLAPPLCLLGKGETPFLHQVLYLVYLAPISPTPRSPPNPSQLPYRTLSGSTVFLNL